MVLYFRVMRYKHLFTFTAVLLFSLSATAQLLEKRLSSAMNRFVGDAQLKHAIASLTVADTNGKIIYHYNDRYGLAPASNMKVFTSIAALDVLGTV